MNAENDLKMWLQRVADSPETLRPVDVERLLDPETVPNGCTIPGMVGWLRRQDVSERVRLRLTPWNDEYVQAQPEVRGEHTPGPWKPTTLYGESTSEPFIVWCDGIGAAVAHVYTRSEMGLANRTTQVANARLIAAAPDLLAVCERLHKHVNGLNATLRATLASYAASELCGELTTTIRDAASAIAKAQGK